MCRQHGLHCRAVTERDAYLLSSVTRNPLSALQPAWPVATCTHPLAKLLHLFVGAPSELCRLQPAAWFSPLRGNLLLPITHHLARCPGRSVQQGATGQYSAALLFDLQCAAGQYSAALLSDLQCASGQALSSPAVCTAVRQCYEFEQASTLGTAEHPNRTGLFDVATCMFALHYFFASEQTLKTFLHNVSVNLKPGAQLSLPEPLCPLLEASWPPAAAFAQHTLRCQVSSRGCKKVLVAGGTIRHCWLGTS